MRILRLGNSLDVIASFPDELRVYRVVERKVAEVTGEPVETVFYRIEPRDTMPAIIDRWVRQHRPDVVLLCVNQYWYGFASAPERLEEMGRIGQLLAKMSWKVSYAAANTAWLADNRVYRWLRSLARGAIGASYLYEPEAVVASMEACLSRLRERHPVLPVGLWSEPVAVVHDLNPELEPELQERRRRVHDPLQAFCDARGIPAYLHLYPLTPFDWRAFRDADHMHLNAAGHAWVAETQWPLIVELWEAAARPSIPVPDPQR